MIRVGMSTSCVFPLSTESAFRMAKAAGFDGVEVMITNDPTTRDVKALGRLVEKYRMPVLSVHAPVLFLTQFVWGLSQTRKLQKSAELAAQLGASTVVVHPPFRWQWRYARAFEDCIEELGYRYSVTMAVENMFPFRIGPVTARGYSPSPDPVFVDCDATTLDFSHASLAGRDSLQLAYAMGDRLRHVHLCDGSASQAEGRLLDEHLVPGRGTQPVAEVLGYLAGRRWNGSLIAEVHTHGSDRERLEMLVETEQFARRHIGQTSWAAPNDTENWTHQSETLR